VDVRVIPRIIKAPEKTHLSRVEHEEAIIAALSLSKVKLILLAGYMRILGPSFLQKCRAHSVPVINIHPSPLPHFPGLSAYQRAFHQGLPYWAVTTHQVTNEMDAGPPLGQCIVSRGPFDSEEQFIKKALMAEHQLYQRTVGKLLEMN